MQKICQQNRGTGTEIIVHVVVSYILFCHRCATKSNSDNINNFYSVIMTKTGHTDGKKLST